MASAREKAREALRAARARRGETKLNPTQRASDYACADAVSDVYEPLLRDLLVAYEHAVTYGGLGHTLENNIYAWGGYTRAKEALNA